VRPPDDWQVIRPRSCRAVGYDRNGGKHVGRGTDGIGHGARVAFDNGVEVLHAKLKVRCPSLRRTYWTTKTVTRWVWRYKSRRGTDTSSRATKGRCYIDRSFSRSLNLDCWGGRYATVSYRFHLPGDARGIDRWARGSRAIDCCTGRLSTDWRYSGNAAVYRVRLTNWRGYTVKRVGVKFLTQVSHRDRQRHVKYAIGKGQRG
jgi:hypothetical protein